MGKVRHIFKIVGRKPEGKRPRADGRIILKLILKK
jgi:hypothetical protein